MRITDPTGSNAPHALVLEGVGKRFGAIDAVAGVDLTVPVGQRRAVLGANGAGKTTLFNLISGELSVTAGKIVLFGQDITRRPVPERIRAGLRRTYQDAMLFDGLTVRENLFVATGGVCDHRFSLKRPSPEHAGMTEADSLLDRVGLRDLADVPVSELSHGQQRVLEIGMALVGDPRLVLFDEPAAGLSPGDRIELSRLLAALPRKMTVILIEHDMDVALPASDFVTVMHNGKILREGSTAEIQADPLVQEIYMVGGGD